MKIQIIAISSNSGQCLCEHHDLLILPFSKNNSIIKKEIFFIKKLIFKKRFRTHMQDLQEVTQEVHYENYRSERLAKGAPVPPRRQK